MKTDHINRSGRFKERWEQVANHRNRTKKTFSVDTPSIDVSRSASPLKALARLLAQSAARAAFEAHKLKKDEADHEPKT